MESLGQISQLLEVHFGETHRRLDALTVQVQLTNGRVREGEIVAATHSAEISTLQREMRDSRHRARTMFGDLKVLVLMAIGLVTGTVAVLQFLGKLQ